MGKNILIAVIFVLSTSLAVAQRAKGKVKSKPTSAPAPVSTPAEPAEEEGTDNSEPEQSAPSSFKAQSPLRSFHVYFSPLYLLLGQIRAGFDFGLSDKLAVGPAIWYAGENSFYRSTDYKATFMATGVRATYNLTGNRFEDGVHVSPFLQYSSIRVESRTDGSNASANGFYYGGVMTYTWYFKTGASFELGAGYHVLTMGDIKVQVGGTTTTVSNSSSYSGLALAANLGWAF